MTAHQNRIDAEMLSSMSSSIRYGLPFSFNQDDMADLLLRVSSQVRPKPEGVK